MASKSICLTMIVKNEAHILIDCFKMLAKYITFDYWVINDNGSTDGTQKLIKDYFAEKGIPGELDETPWRDFAFNRTRAFELAYRKSDYAFVWDADDEITGNFVMPTNLTGDSYKFIFGNDEGFRYSRPQLFNNKLKWCYKGVLHEYAECTEPSKLSIDVSGDYYFISGRKGDRSKDPNKYLKDALVLEKASAEALATKDPLYNRYIFYCAQSYTSCGMREKAIEFYKKALTLPLWIQEKYIACLEIFDAYDALKNPEEGLRYLVESHSYDPNRIECIYRLIKYYCIKQNNHVAFMYYTLIQDYYENKYCQAELPSKLFVKQCDYDFFMPYYMIIVSENVKRLDITAKMYAHIVKYKYLHVNEWWIRNLIHNMQFCIKELPYTLNFFHDLIDYVSMLQERGIVLEGSQVAIMSNTIDHFKGLLSQPLSQLPLLQRNTNPKVIFTVTTCKRFDLFEKTMNSILQSWTDIAKVDYFFCVDDNSRQIDRSNMTKAYPFIDFYMKNHSEKGHRKSMNIIYDKLAELKPTYWIHIEDDWLFFKRDSYVQRSMDFLDKYENRNIHQILYNRNYTELYEFDINGGTMLEPGFLLHVKSDTIPGRNSAYWPHYSFRPSMMRVSSILALGNYDSSNSFFERDYANKYFAKGYMSAFFNTVTSLHIGKLTSDKSGTNAYTLNGVGQFGIIDSKKQNTFVVNLIRRTDRKEAVEIALDKHDIDYEFFEAVDGTSLKVTDEIINLFKGNDFGSTRGVIGCALSHLTLWKRLVNEEAPFYTIFEDDIHPRDDFSERFKYVKNNMKGDIIFLGYHSRNTNIRSEKSDPPLISLPLDAYIGGFFAYIITLEGAKKLLNYININGIKHGIDYLIKIIPGFESYVLQPHCVYSDWVMSTDSPVDSDIQKDFTCLPIVKPVLVDGWDFHEGVDSPGDDICFLGTKNINTIISKAVENINCVAFNTLGFLKSNVQSSLVKTPYINRGGSGIYIKKSYTPLTRIKMLCNWCSSQDLCKEWLKMTKSNYRWNNIQITWEDDVDYYIIINKPKPGDVYIPEKTIIFHMEPWCGDASQSWGVKTWGEWAAPDPTKFLQVRSHNNFMNTVFWQVPITYTEFKNTTIIKRDINTISSVCSSKYFDPGHKKRIDFLKFLESKGVNLHIYNEDNTHNFKSYQGKARPDIDKEKGLMPYKYYFMCENNAEQNFITEKLWEPILCECLCFYWGCPNVGDYVDPLAYVQLDMDDFEKSSLIIKESIENNLWEERLPILQREKEKLLDTLGFFPVVQDILKPKIVCFIHSCHLASAGTEKLDMLLEHVLKIKEIESIIINNIGLPLVSSYSEDPRIKVIQHSESPSLFELPTLKLISEFSKKNPFTKVLYLHTKGISYTKSDNRYSHGLDWIQFMLHFLCTKASECLSLLDVYDTLGCNFMESPHPHYSGNFWWATTKYLKTLRTDKLTDKMSAEWWLLSGNPNKYVLHTSGKNHFLESYPQYMYIHNAL